MNNGRLSGGCWLGVCRLVSWVSGTYQTMLYFPSMERLVGDNGKNIPLIHRWAKSRENISELYFPVLIRSTPPLPQIWRHRKQYQPQPQRRETQRQYHDKVSNGAMYAVQIADFRFHSGLLQVLALRRCRSKYRHPNAAGWIWPQLGTMRLRAGRK